MTATEETNNVASTEKTSNTGKERSTSRHIIVLASGDLLAFLAFSAIGRGSHGEATGLAAIPAVIVTAAPFAIAWFIVSPFIAGSSSLPLLVFTARNWWPIRAKWRDVHLSHGCSPGPSRWHCAASLWITLFRRLPLL